MSEDLIRLQAEPIDAGRAWTLESTAGGVCVFLGTTRSETNSDGRALIALDYEAYEQMAVRQMRDLAARARRRWPIVKLAILHRVGRVALGEPSVLIAVATPHRAEAFEACRWLIDTLKAETAIWKKEVWADGTGTWVHPEEGAKGEGRGTSRD
ncbi:MAG: molybdenum cofactor biosynthesis protein MoaE [Tepidisphaeraceae bacterium]